MNKRHIEERTFEKIDFSEKGLAKGDYENCSFISCNFSNTDLSNIHFMECIFRNCNLSMAKIKGVTFRGVKFRECKLLGLHFEHCNKFLFSVDFENCILNLSSFYKLNFKKNKVCSMQHSRSGFYGM